MNILWVEVILAVVLGVSLGFFIGRWKGGLTLLGSVALFDGGLLAIVYMLGGYIPLHQLPFTFGKFVDQSPYLVIAFLVVEATLWAVLGAAALGYFFNGLLGTVVTSFATVVAGALAGGMTIGLFYWFSYKNSLSHAPVWAFGGAILLIGVGGTWLFAKVFKTRWYPVMVLWFEFVLSCWLGYALAGNAGILFIALPSQVLLWGSLYLFAAYSLPFKSPRPSWTWLDMVKLFFLDVVYAVLIGAGYLLGGGLGGLLGEVLAFALLSGGIFLHIRSVDDRKQIRQSFRSLLSFNLGTNFPFYVVDDWRTKETVGQIRPQPRVPGNSFLQFFSGPGIVINDCNHVSVTSNGTGLTVHPPGVSFFGAFADLRTDLDLRPQLRTTTVEAETKDGIKVKIFSFMPNRVPTGGESVALGRSFPYDEEAVKKIAYDYQLLDHKFWRDQNQQAIEEIKTVPWEESVLTVGPTILKEIIANYTCNELHMAHPDKFRDTSATKGSQLAAPEVPKLNSFRPDLYRLRQFLDHYFGLEDLREIAFELAGNYWLFLYEEKEDLTTAMVADFSSDDRLGCLLDKIQEKQIAPYLKRLFPHRRPCSGIQVIQVTLSGEKNTSFDVAVLGRVLGKQLAVSPEHISIIGAVLEEGSLRILIGVWGQEEPLELKSSPPMEITAYDELSLAERRAWQFAAVNYPPRPDKKGRLRPTVYWADVLPRDPRVEIAGQFAQRLREVMPQYGIEMIGGGISNILVPREITEQRVKNWESDREHDIDTIVGEAQAEIVHQLEQVRGEMRMDLLRQLLQIIQKEGTLPKSVLAGRLFEAVGAEQYLNEMSISEKDARQIRSLLQGDPV